MLRRNLQTVPRDVFEIGRKGEEYYQSHKIDLQFLGELKNQTS